MTRELVLLDLDALTADDAGHLADALLVASNHPRISRRGGDALADLADQMIRRSRKTRRKEPPPMSTDDQALLGGQRRILPDPPADEEPVDAAALAEALLTDTTPDTAAGKTAANIERWR
ncbi:hypothetical protein RB614_19725 [Phytohabitans sp. ZYX-F-186]|uniref:DUF222 domain-containing protein n=1 Tax=Phytohabitans maris TaxID=3071409 RepID=A0ABU0ZI72_9ACTN|nr:hypothetical protein [Phytohabitans sp. ZYX-F-186]MDQ7906749.1 hypothetical protein [Phytohabitans sp. ZYX-F-186]